jgi:hypothetical protein
VKRRAVLAAATATLAIPMGLAAAGTNSAATPWEFDAAALDGDTPPTMLDARASRSAPANRSPPATRSDARAALQAPRVQAPPPDPTCTCRSPPRPGRAAQALLLGLWRGWPVPTIAALRTDGCTYARIPPAPVWPAPIPPDLPLPWSGRA